MAKPVSKTDVANGKAHGDKLKKANIADHQREGTDDGFTRVDDNYEKVEFKNVGDSLIAYYTGKKRITPPAEGGKDPFDILTFYTPDGRRVSTPANYQLEQAMDKETELVSTQFKIVFKGKVPSGKGEMSTFEIFRKPNCEEIPVEFLVK